MPADVIMHVPEVRQQDWAEIQPLNNGLPATFEAWQAAADDLGRQFEADRRVTLRRIPITVADFRREFARLGRPLEWRDRARLAVELGAATTIGQEESLTFDFLDFDDPPDVTRARLEECQRQGDFRPILFDWYRYVGLRCNHLISLDWDSSQAVREIDPRHRFVLVGLLNRCARLMLSIVALSHDGGNFGETTAIIDRSIFESAVKVIWLCEAAATDKFDRYFADQFKSDIEMRDRIRGSIAARGDDASALEGRMLTSIDARIGTTGMTEEELLATSRLPDVAAMLDAVGRPRLIYLVGQKMGSHHVHGSWASLLLHYLEPTDDGGYAPRDHDCPTDINQFAFVSMVVLEAMRAFARHAISDDDYAARVLSQFDEYWGDIQRIYMIAKGYLPLDGDEPPTAE